MKNFFKKNSRDIFISVGLVLQFIGFFIFDPVVAFSICGTEILYFGVKSEEN